MLEFQTDRSGHNKETIWVVEASRSNAHRVALRTSKDYTEEAPSRASAQ